MNKKGFTLIELMIVVAIVGVLSLVLVPNVIIAIDKSKEKSCNNLVANIESAAKLYVTNNKYDLAFTCGGTIEIKFKTLVDSGDLDLEDGGKLTNPLDDSDINLNNTVSVTYDCNTKTFLYHVNGITCSDGSVACAGVSLMPNITNKVYNGSEQIGVTGGSNITISGDKKGVNVGEYNVSVSPKSGYCWEDNTTSIKNDTWKITPNKPIVKLNDKTATYTGSKISIDSASVKNSTGVSLTSIPVVYTYYKGTSCTGDVLSNAPINSGNYSVSAHTNSSGQYNASDSVCAKLTITKATPTLTTSKNSIAITYPNTDSFTYTYNGDGTLSCSSSNTAVATCGLDASSKTVTIVPQKIGSSVVTITAAEGTNYKSVSKTVSISINGTDNPLTVTPIEGLIYNKKAQTLVETTNAQGTVYYSTSTKLTSSNYTSGSTTISTGTNSKTYTVYYYTPGNSTYGPKSGNVNVTISKASCACTISSVTTTLKYPDSTSGTVSYSCTGDGTRSVTSSTTSVIKVGNVGTTSTPITALGKGKSTLTVSQTSGSNYNACTSSTKDVEVSLSTYKINYDANGGTNAPSSQTKTYGVDLEITTNEPTRSGYTFIGWHTNKDSTSAMYKPKDVYTTNKSMTLYAVWAIEEKRSTLVDYITKLYTDARKTTITNTKEDYGTDETVQYNYATDVMLMNDRLGGYGNISSGYYFGPSLLDDYNGGNIRYYGASPNNYIYFNCSDYSNQSASTCEKWRIIGVMKDMTLSDGTKQNLVKIVRDSSIGKIDFDTDRVGDPSYDSSDGGSRYFDWVYASLNEELNEYYYNGEAIGTLSHGIKNDATRSLIQEVVWNLGMVMISSDTYPDDSYIVEREISTNPIYGEENYYDTGNIALIYASDYGFATNLSLCDQSYASSAYSNTYPSNPACIGNNWIYSGDVEWILNRSDGGDVAARAIFGDGTIYSRVVDDPQEVRPTLYLKYETSINDLGDGSSEKPYQIITSGSSSSSTSKYTVSYNANGGTNAPSSQTKTYGEWLTLSSKEPTRDGYHFVGWNTDRTATSATYQPNDLFGTNSNTTLYAIWQKVGNTLVEHITNLYTNAPKTTIKHNNISYNYATSVNLMNDRLGGETTDYNGGNIRYYGGNPHSYEGNPNNYIYFNCSDYSNQNSDTCELWRIIGVFEEDSVKKVKIMRGSSIGTYAWNVKDGGSNSGRDENEWSDADLMKLLNPGYESEAVNGSLYWNSASGTCYSAYNNSTGSSKNSCDFTNTGLKNTTTRNLIADSTWHLRGDDYPNFNNVNEKYLIERINGTVYTSSRSLTWKGKVALSYASDYAYAAELDTCNQIIGNYRYCNDSNWMFLSVFKNTGANLLSPVSHTGHTIELIGGTGDVSQSETSTSLNIFPTLYLNSNVAINTKGDGSKEKPYQILIS